VKFVLEIETFEYFKLNNTGFDDISVILENKVLLKDK